jgi:hypothetical protein
MREQLPNGLWRTRCGATRTSGGPLHLGGRLRETGRVQRRRRAPGRPHHGVAIIDDQTKILARARVADDAVGFGQLLAHLTKHGDDQPARSRS